MTGSYIKEGRGSSRYMAWFARLGACPKRSWDSATRNDNGTKVKVALESSRRGFSNDSSISAVQ